MALRLTDLIVAPSRGSGDEAMAYAKRQGAKRQAFLADYFSELWRLPPLTGMKRGMFALGHDLEIVRVIVAAIAVDVVHDLVSLKQATQFLLHHQTVFSDVAATSDSVRMFGHVDVNVPVTFVCRPALARRASTAALRNTPALRRAKPMAVTAKPFSVELFAANGAILQQGSSHRHASLCSTHTGVGAKPKSLGAARGSFDRLAAVSAMESNAPLILGSLRHSLTGPRTVFRLGGTRTFLRVRSAAYRTCQLNGSRLTRHFADLLHRSVRCRARSAPTLPGFVLPEFYQIGGA